MTLDMTSVQELTAEFARAKNELTEKGKALFTDISQQLFDKHDKLDSFGWQQYTDYFADGDTCTFSVHADRDYGIDINGENVDELENTRRETYQNTGKKVMQMQGWGDNRKEVEVDERAYLPNPDYDPVMGDIVNDVADLINGIPSEVMEDMFGDHVQITVARDGITVDEYTEHD